MKSPVLSGKSPLKPSKEKLCIPNLHGNTQDLSGITKKKLSSLVNLRYLYQPGELEGGSKRATNPIWSLKVYNIEKSVTKPNELVLYYLQDEPKRGFVPEELLVVPPNSELPPANP